eukprot:CAMPEP_0119005180 /NCGR_PEP_ID=MMETSP1176-20130426/1570_1 /TAXON_ID=265551 /ORGANISM="Synedropsis recta cf, Strain CCMP1620" /LENGTH=290 /DNA_ID=CAMNT_0006956957 /DNA_START=89 /DNA_END=961 /DNA_ORIENTATION=-
MTATTTTTTAVTATSQQQQQQQQQIPVALYIPNLLCYIRIVTAFLGLHYSSSTTNNNNRPWVATWIWIFSAGLDLLDGLLARALHQTSTLGIFLDICADNILRTCIWMAAMLEYHHLSYMTTNDEDQQSSSSSLSLSASYVTMIACIIVSTEWLTMVSTQLHSANDGNDGHWKTARLNDPWLVRQVFAGGFQGSPLGVWTIYGLFAAPLSLWIAAHPDVLQQRFASTIPFFTVFQTIAYAGRAFGFGIELYLTCSYLSHVIDQDTNNNKNNNNNNKRRRRDDAVAAAKER